MPHPKFKYIVPHSPEWRVLRTEEMRRTRKIRDCEGNLRLAPGRPPNPDLERCLCNLTTLLTEKEHKAFLKSKPKHVSVSTWLRAMVCEWLESRRSKHLPTLSFTRWMEEL